MHTNNIAIIGSSAGGPRILKEIFTDMPRLHGSLVLVQHMPEFVNQSFSQSITMRTDLTVTVAKYGDELENGKVYIAPSEIHCVLVNNQKIRLFEGEKVNYVCPSVDVTMKSVIRKPGMNIIGIVLTGMGRDGSDGVVHINKLGGATIAQDKESSIVYGMPNEAVKTGCIDMVLNPLEIREKLIEIMGVY